jgi:hypothetical protein
MLGKFTLDSDFVDSYLNFYSLNQQHEDLELMNNALIFAQCVNLNKTVSKTADCAAKRESVHTFVEKNDKIKSNKDNIKANCKDQVLKAHQIFYALNKESKASSVIILSDAFQQAERDLTNCLHKY